MQEALVSVVMPTFNHEAFIAEAISSVLNQSYPHWELIIVDNFSKDKTAQIVQSFTDSRIRYYQFSNHGIIAASRNHGIEHSRGQYVAFLDSDDLWTKDKLKTQIELFEREQEIGLVSGLFSVNDTTGEWAGKVLGPKEKINGYIYDQLIKNNFIVSSSVVVRKSVFKEVGKFEEEPRLVCVEDFDFWLRIAKKYKIAVCPSVLGTYRKHTFNMNAAHERLQKALYVLDKQFTAGRAGRKEIDRAKANFYFQVGWAMLDQDVKLARSYFREAIKLNLTNVTMFLVNMAGLFFSMIPGVFKFFKSRRWDKKLGHLLLNPQNL